jgi:NAD(P)-dependent dehydrogenase (short-subunit alcohol dehydrogenase family)
MTDTDTVTRAAEEATAAHVRVEALDLVKEAALAEEVATLGRLEALVVGAGVATE